MEAEELKETVRQINDQLKAIVRNQRTLAGIRRQIEERADDPLEEDFIDAASYDQPIGTPKIRNVDGVTIVVWKLHRRGARSVDVAGADVLYEIEGTKFVTIQYKKANRQNRVENDSAQLDTLMATCSHPCPPSSLGRDLHCGAWYCVTVGKVAVFHRACAASSIFTTHASRGANAFAKGLSQTDFDQKFADCRIGAPIDRSAILSHMIEVLAANHLLVYVQQFGVFGPVAR